MSCDNYTTTVPYTSVYETLYDVESDPEYRSLRSLYSAFILTDDDDCIGYECNGVLVYRVNINDDDDDFVVYDRTCPYEVSEDCAIEWDSGDPYYATCPCCGSKFNLVGGYVEEGPAEYPLRIIKCEYINGNLYIY